MIIRILFLYTGSHCDNPVVWIQLFPHPRGPRPGGVWVLVHGLPDRPLRSYQVATFLSLASCQSGAKHLLHHYSSIFKKSFTREIKLAKTFLSSYNFYNYPTARIKRILFLQDYRHRQPTTSVFVPVCRVPSSLCLTASWTLRSEASSVSTGAGLGFLICDRHYNLLPGGCWCGV